MSVKVGESESGVGLVWAVGGWMCEKLPAQTSVLSHSTLFLSRVNPS